ncbi:MAG: hypothetical protein M1118_14830 [Chloroflexi bacterium]|nr:hypothetical protein [Chloroflexota bacterium]
MLGELTRHDWQAFLKIPEHLIPPVLILRGTRNLKAQYELYRGYFDEVIEIGTPNGVLEDVLVGVSSGVRVAYASVYGGPMAAEVTHLFGVLGTSLVILTGCCGALADDIAAGDLVLATEAYCGEGSAQYYRAGTPLVQRTAPAGLDTVLARLSDLTVHHGRLYTTGALFAQRACDIEQWYRDGFSAVDMETATTFAVAEHFHMDCVSLLFAFDNPRRKEHLLLADTAKDERRRVANRRMIEASFELAQQYVAPTRSPEDASARTGR